MQFLKTLFWVIFAVIAAALSFNNWVPVRLALWSPLELVVKLPVLVAIAFLAGLLPGIVLHRTERWRMRRRLDAAERTVAGLRTPVEAEPVTPLVADPSR